MTILEAQPGEIITIPTEYKLSSLTCGNIRHTGEIHIRVHDPTSNYYAEHKKPRPDITIRNILREAAVYLETHSAAWSAPERGYHIYQREILGHEDGVCQYGSNGIYGCQKTRVSEAIDENDKHIRLEELKSQDFPYERFTRFDELTVFTFSGDGGEKMMDRVVNMFYGKAGYGGMSRRKYLGHDKVVYAQSRSCD